MKIKNKTYLRILKIESGSYSPKKGIFIDVLAGSKIFHIPESYLFNFSPKGAEFLIRELNKQLEKAKNERQM